jgi:hypothetical protein
MKARHKNYAGVVTISHGSWYYYLNGKATQTEDEMTEMTEGRQKFLDSKLYWPSLIGLYIARLIIILAVCYGRPEAQAIITAIVKGN